MESYKREKLKMKKIKIYKQIKVKGIKYKQEIEAENFINPDLAIYKDEKGNGVIIDIKTGLVIACAKRKNTWKKPVIQLFNNLCGDLYYEFIKTEEYQKNIKEFNELEEYHPGLKEIKEK